MYYIFETLKKINQKYTKNHKIQKKHHCENKDTKIILSRTFPYIPVL